MIQSGLIVTAPGQCELATRPLALPAPGEVTVAADYLGICGSDLHRIYDLPLNSWGPGLGRPGHEIAGRVVECPSGRLRPGDPVLVVPLPSHAEGFVDVLNVAEERVLPLPESLGTFRGLLCQQVGTVIYALKRFWPGTGDGTAVVVGGGAAGQAFIALLKQRGFPLVVAADYWRGRLAACRGFGADLTVQVPGENLAAVVADLTGGEGATLVVEAAGTAASRRTAMDCVGVRGTVGFFGLPGPEPVETFPFGFLFRRQARLEMAVGSQHEPGLASFREAIDLVNRGGFAVEDMVSHRFPLGRIAAALDLARAAGHGVRKVVVEVSVARSTLERQGGPSMEGSGPGNLPKRSYRP